MRPEFVRSITQLAGFVFTLGLMSAAPTQSTEVWVAADPNTRSITRMEFSGNRSRVRIMAACSPTDCDWGTVSVRNLDPKGVNSPGEGQPYELVVDQSIARREIRLNVQQEMTYFMRTVYKDRRPSKESQGTLRRQ
ncbi:hypothetical protein [Arsenicibacter rosenii]|uniref:Uncharacterized protein n=1 Tax=Arsenicibacter rosenii TaxID=1750698 RepID=A0A1S2VQJ5_9BACT|nr:hypothetical protein [Arsenicibacter rosenii]OIN61032.1 hypothetical protein BLX24_02845 [Arsenicibacter rosenii]